MAIDPKRVAKVIDKFMGPLFQDPIEQAYWNFDARRKGLGPWKGQPMSEREAFKAELRLALFKTL